MQKFLPHYHSSNLEEANIHQKRFLWLDVVRSCCVLLKKNAARSQSLEAQGSLCSFWPKLSNDPNLSKIHPCLAEIGPTLFQPNQQERTAPNQRNRLCKVVTDDVQRGHRISKEQKKLLVFRFVIQGAWLGSHCCRILSVNSRDCH